jgi:hypothetical protein
VLVAVHSIEKNGESILVSFSFSSFTYSVGCLHFAKKYQAV